MDPSDFLISLDDGSRPSRPPDFQREAQALRRLGEGLAERPEGALDHLTQILVQEGIAESAGVSLLSGDGTRFTWMAIAGAWHARVGGGMPVDASPCGEVVARQTTLLFCAPHLCFPAIDGGTGSQPAREMLLAPLHSDGRIVGTFWALLHSHERHFDAEDARLLGSLARFAGVAFRLTVALEAEHDAHGALKQIRESLESRVEHALAEKKIFADVIEHSSAAVTVLSTEFTILAINIANVDAFERAFGVRPQVGDHFLSLFEGFPDVRRQQEAIWSRALTGENFAVTDEFGHEGRDKRYYEVRFSPLLDRHGRHSGASSTSYDVTDRVQAEVQRDAAQEQLRQAQKMEAMGQLTGGVAHDFNNLLQPIVTSLDVLRRGLGTEERRQRLIQAALQSADRARTLVQRLLAFSRRQPLQPTRVDVAALVVGMSDLLRSTLGPRIDLQLALDGDMPAAVADENQLEMALLNLCVNARDAMPEGGVLRVGVALREGAAERPADLRDGGYVCLSVTDSGQGMDEATLRRAVEPFFSTKGIGKGTGLGLSMVDGLARQLGGALVIDSSVGSGTEATLWLPATERAAEVAAADPALSARMTGAGLALVVDDEELVRLVAADMLVELGFEVAEFASAEEALAAMRQGLKPRLVVTDHLMAGMNGTDLARQLARDWPRVPVLIMSGYAELQGIASEFQRLSKPFSLGELSQRVMALGVLVGPGAA